MATGMRRMIGDIGDASKIPLPVDISISSDDNLLWVDTWNDGMTRVFDISDPFAPKETYTQKIGDQINMLSQSWDGKGSTSPRPCSVTGTRKKATKATCSISRPMTGMARRSSTSSPSISLRRNWAGHTRCRFGAYSLYAAAPAKDDVGWLQPRPNSDLTGPFTANAILLRALLLTLVTAGPSAAHQGETHGDSSPPQVLAPGYEPLAYDAPEPGSYGCR